jgi:tetrapyrrole methylase family protein/MazG family protein
MKIERLLDIISKLRGPDGCPWDKAQTHESLAPYAIEEALELEAAIYTGEAPLIKEELGDVLLQVVLHAQLLKERGQGDFEAIAELLSEKLVRRHPHVFGDVHASSAADVQKNWQDIKAQEKKGTPTNPLEVKSGLPALRRAHQIGEKSREWKFDWPESEQVWDKVQEELNELRTAPQEDLEEELGDLLFTLAQWARHKGLEPETALQKANNKFEKRFAKVLTLAQEKNRTWESLSDTEKDILWNQVKREEKDK